jgi:hypothetical protein
VLRRGPKKELHKSHAALGTITKSSFYNLYYMYFYNFDRERLGEVEVFILYLRGQNATIR